MWCAATCFYWTPMQRAKFHSKAETHTIHITHTLTLGFHSNQQQHLAEDWMTKIASHILLIAHFSLSSLQSFSYSPHPINKGRGLCGNSFPLCISPSPTPDSFNMFCAIQKWCRLKVKRAAVSLNEWTNILFVMYYKDVCCGASQVFFFCLEETSVYFQVIF